MKRHGMSVLMLAALWSASLAGCKGSGMTIGMEPPGQSPTAGPTPELAGQAQPPIADLPVPAGFRLLEGRSRNFTAAGARYADHVYHGWADKFAVARFYKRQMPISRWALVTDMFVQGSIILDFEKDTERCRITVKDSLVTTTIEAAVWTSGRIIPPSGVSPRRL